ncbi:MAG TPA: hypothetical protein PLL86_26385, partial [Leptospiraceae bacterium]|nr:hypothetical protein [Leptospiraceae bacterium]
SEGELPFKCLVGRKSLSVDLRSERKGFANFDYAEEEQHLFVGRYFEVEDLKLENLRQIEGW